MDAGPVYKFVRSDGERITREDSTRVVKDLKVPGLRYSTERGDGILEIGVFQVQV